MILAAVLTGLNALKPLHVDDTTYYFNAAQIAAHPFDPYGYTILYWSDPLPALHVLAPPVLPYWWAGAIRLFGERPVLWKMWLFPFVLLFVSSLAGLLRRFAPTVAAPLLVLLTLSPIFLPSLNLMIDIPALALSSTSLRLFFWACDRDSPAVALVAGLTAGLAMQTKYTAILAPAVFLAYAVVHGKMRLSLLAVAIAGFVFASWEMILVLRYGESHFLHQIEQGHYADDPKSKLLGSLCPLLGGAAPTLALLALTVLRWPNWLLFAAALLALFPYLLLVWLDPVVGRLDAEPLSLTAILFACNGGAILLGMACAAARRPHSRTAWFLVIWLGLELAAYVAISPFAAVRRIMGITVAATLLLGHLAMQSPLEPWRKNVLYGLAAVTALLGLGFFGVDYLEARAEQQAVYEAAHRIRQGNPHAVIWYAGYWGFQYYAEEIGMKQAVPLRHAGNRAADSLPPSPLHRGDWLVIPSASIPQQELDLDRPELELKDQFSLTDGVPLSTLMDYYAGSLPLRHRHGPRIAVRLFRVKDDLIPRLRP